MSTDRSIDSLLRLVLIVIAALVLLPMVTMALAMPMMGLMGLMGWGWMGGQWGHSPLWSLGMALVWLLVIGIIGYALYRAATGENGVGGTDPALEELRLAYARGDLSDAEFESRRERLRREE